jgi:uracil-DNA glycosylase family 4
MDETEKKIQLDEIRSRIEECTKCDLSKKRIKPTVGKGSESPDVVFIGEAAGAEEDKIGVPFVGRSGKLLDKWLEYILNRVEFSFYILNVVKCRSVGVPTPEQIATCNPYLEKQLAILKPRIVVCMGKTAFEAVTGKKYSLRLCGKYTDGVYVMPHPAYCLRQGDDMMHLLVGLIILLTDKSQKNLLAFGQQRKIE